MAAYPARAEQQPRLPAAAHAPPSTLEGATVLDTPGAFAVWRDGGAIFVDVLARPPRPARLPAQAVWRNPKRMDIPGSIWLPETGYEELSPAALHYFETSLADATANDKSRRLVFYCRPDCWASWHAAKRALSLGYAKVSWYPGGADGWSAAGYALEERMPAPGQPSGQPQ
jgi:PQQ-dependent catabolism-associated CXXCW motif protein